MAWSWLLLAAVGLTSWWWVPSLLAVLDSYWSLPWEERDQRASVAGMVIGAASLAVGTVSILQNRRRPSTSAVAVGEIVRAPRVEFAELLLMRNLSAGRARVHEALPLPEGQSRHRRRWWALRRVNGTTLDADLPLFVPRELSEEVAAWMRQARREGGFLLLVGTSSVGKTRLLFEIARQELGDARVLVPDLGDGGAVNALADAALPGPVVVWLDELQRFVAGPYFVTDDSCDDVPVTAAVVRRLLDGETPVIVLATLWPDYLDQLRVSDTDDAGVTRSRHPGAADVLALRSKQLRVDTFTSAERHRARKLGTRDPRLAFAVRDADFNVTETLAGAPRIMQRYREAPAERQAVVHAAVDARRLGIQGPLSRRLLCEAARGYLIGIHADDVWFDRALAELTRHDRRDDAATAPLLAIATADHRRVLGYTVTDYLLQELLQQRRSALLSDVTWNAFLEHTDEIDDRRRLAWEAERRMQYRHAHRLYRVLSEAGDIKAIVRVAKRLAKQGRVDEAVRLVRPLAAAGQSYVVLCLSELLEQQGQIGEAVVLLRGQVDAGHRYADLLLVEMLARHGLVEALFALALGGDTYASAKLVPLLTERSMVEPLRELAETGSAQAAAYLGGLLIEQGKIDEGTAWLRAHFHAVHARSVAFALWLVERGETDDALAVLRSIAHDNPLAATLVTEMSEGQNTIDELRALAGIAAPLTSHALASMLAEHGMVDELRVRADTGDLFTLSLFNDQLVKHGMIDELRARGDAGDTEATIQLARYLAARGRFAESIALLRNRADTNSTIARALAGLLAEHDEHELLWKEVHAGNNAASQSLIDLLRATGQEDHAERLRMWGVTSDGLPSLPW